MKKKKILFDILLISVLLCLSLCLFAVTIFNREKGSTVTVEVAGKAVGTYSLDKDLEIEINGGTHNLVIKDGYVYLTDADCPDKTCVKTGKISYSGQSIICLPNRVIIKIVGDTDISVDLVS